MPVIAAKTISFTDAAAYLTSGGIKTVPLETSDDIFKDVTWPHAGVYIYTIKETPGSAEGMVYSPAEYDVSVYVANGINNLYVAGIGANIVVNDPSNEGSAPDTKVDPAPGDPDVLGDYSSLIFTNKYLESGKGGDPLMPENTMLAISNRVTGEYGDMTKYFQYQLTVNKPTTVTGEAFYTAYVVEQDASDVSTVVTSADNYDGFKTNTYGNFIEVDAGTPINIKLKNGQKLLFTDMHIGSSYQMVQSAIVDYTAQVDIVVDSGAPINLANITDNMARSTSPNDAPSLMRIVGKGDNSAGFTNEYKEISITGLSIDILPYIIMIALALASLMIVVAMLISRRKSTKIR